MPVKRLVSRFFLTVLATEPCEVMLFDLP